MRTLARRRIGGLLDAFFEFAKKQQESAGKIVVALRNLNLEGIRRVRISVISGLLSMTTRRTEVRMVSFA